MPRESTAPKKATNPAGEGPAVPGRKRASPWKGRRKVADPKSKIVPIRFTPEQHEALAEKANRAGMSVGMLARTILLGDAGPRAVKRPPVEKADLARILGAIGKLGGNINQITKVMNETRDMPGRDDLAQMRADIAVMRAEVMVALGKRSEPL